MFKTLAILFLMPIMAHAQTFNGKASFYSDKLHGNETASGEKYDKFALTAAHRTLPFGTWVRVTNLWNGKSVDVKINDRGPFGNNGRIIDLSKQAALELQMITAGIIDVKVEIIDKDAPKPEPEIEKETSAKKETTGTKTKVRGDGTYKVNFQKSNSLQGFGVQVGSFTEFMTVIKLLEELEEKGFPDLYINTDVVKNKRVYRIIVGNFEKRSDAELYLVSVKSKGIDGYVIAHQK
ncbi:MAG: septal ring lytic transglycosylase RlpA family protein [Bacteroidia bacterium]